jgi:hypothetical protein
MSFFSAIGSIEALAEHLRAEAGASRDAVMLLRHLNLIAGQMDIEIDRDFLLREAECWQAKALSTPARQFIAKRLFAFWRKGLRPVLEQNLTLFPACLPDIPTELAIELLQFAPMSNETMLLAEMPEPTEEPSVGTFISTPPPVAMQPTDPAENGVKVENHVEIENHVEVEMEEEFVSTISTESATSPFDHARINAEKAGEIEKNFAKIRAMPVPVLALENYQEKLLAKLAKNAPQYVVEAIQGIFYLYHTTQEKYPLMCLKNAILQYRNVISAPANVLVCVNYGLAAAEELVYKFSQLSRLAPLNEQVYVFLWKNFEVAILQHVQNFRQAVERCKNHEDLWRLLAQYPLVCDTIFKQYPALDVIRQVKAVSDRAVPEPQDAARIISECWEEGEANMKRHLTWLLVESKVHNKIYQSLANIVNVNQLCKALHKLTKSPDTERTARMLLQLIVTFLKGKQKISFREVQTGVNFVPPFLRERLLLPIKRKLKRELEQKMQDVLGSRLRLEKRWRKLIELLNNPQWQTPDIQIFGYSLPGLRQKIEKVLDADGKAEVIVSHIFAGGNIPSSLRELIIARYGYGETYGKKDMPGCQKELAKLKEAVQNGHVLSLRRPLVHLLQSYGQVNFSTSEEIVTGYHLSQIVARFYHNPARTVFTLPLHVLPEVAQLLTQTIQEEQERQKRKIEEENKI